MGPLDKPVTDNTNGIDKGVNETSWTSALVACDEIPPITTVPTDEDEFRPMEEKRSESPIKDVINGLGNIAIDDENDGLATAITGESSPRSEFRQALDDEARERDRISQLEQERIAQSKRLLRQSLNSITAMEQQKYEQTKENSTAYTDSFSSEGVLTRPERHFLEALLESNGPGVAEACMEAYRKLSDVNLFFWTICSGSAGEVSDLIPGHGWTTMSSMVASESKTCLEVPSATLLGIDESKDWVQNWVARGSKESNEEQRKLQNYDDTKNQSSSPKKQQECDEEDKILSSQPSKSSDLSDSTAELLQPYELQRESSEARLVRLSYRKQQSSNGEDSVRLFRAHEAGLVVTQQGSARRSLMRMGLSMEKSLYPPLHSQNKLRDNISLHSNEISTKVTELVTEEPTAFLKELEKIDERAIRKIEKDERAKCKQLTLQPESIPFHSVGCLSPFRMSILKKMYASKQLSFQRQSSSYSRYDSFLNTTSIDEIENDVVSESKSFRTLEDDLFTDVDFENIFRSRRRASSSGERLQNLLINAGLLDPVHTGYVNVTDSSPEVDEEIMSTSNNSVAYLLRGGPSFRDETVFRDSIRDERERNNRELNTVVQKRNVSSLVSSIGSEFSATDFQEDNSETINVSPASSDVGELPPLSSKSHFKRSSTTSIMKTSSTSSLSKKGPYQRSVSWSQIVASKDTDEKSPRISDTDSDPNCISVISFPNLRRAAPLRSNSISSNASGISIPSLRLGRPLRSESLGSSSSLLSSIPPLFRAHPVFSPRSSFAFTSPPRIYHARAIRSESQTTLGTEVDDSSTYSFSYLDVSNRQVSSDTTEKHSVTPKRWQPPMYDSRAQSNLLLDPAGHSIIIRQASRNNYEGEGMEIDELVNAYSLDSARNFKSMVSFSDSVISGRSRSQSFSSKIPMKSFDDSFIVRNLDFERLSSEILRSLSNEDLYTSHNVETIGGSAHLHISDPNSVARVFGDLTEIESWDLHSNHSFEPPQNAWSVLEDEYAEGYGALNSLPFQILGTSASDTSCHPHVLSPPLMESLLNFFPPILSENNFWLKYSLVRDGASLLSLLRHVRGAKYTLIAIESVDGEVFGSFTSTPWRKNGNYYGNGEAFLWRMRRTRSDKDLQHSIIDQAKLESELDVFYWTGKNDMVQYCTHDMIAVGGGDLSYSSIKDMSSDEMRDMPLPTGIMSSSDHGGFGLAIDAELLRGTSSSCETFRSPPLSQAHSDGSPFEIVNLEVWTFTSCTNVADAENMEMKKFFLEPTSTKCK